ncbi:MAG TPA: dihydropteroate synthase [Eubacteriaceae bacterium]|nr:dihydropteroate synthase [Eubacteriaceae bacterium]
MKIKKRLEKSILIFDGAMGTMIQNSGLKLGELPELLNIHSPETIIDIHKSYIEAGSMVITTNTFGANELKLKNSGYKVEEIVDIAVANAKKARGNKDIYIALDIGPIGELLEPMGTLSFEDAYNIFKRQVLQGVKSGVDLILIETMTDLYEIKAAILAVKENCNLPVFATMSFEENMRTFTGCTPESMVLILQGLGVDGLGVNCSLGPKEIEPIVDKILNISKVPIIVQANAGLPKIVDGETTYNIAPEEFAQYSRVFIEKGVRIIGGCCGTTDKHIRKMVNTLKDVKAKTPIITPIGGICTPTKTVFTDRVRVVGERINPTGKNCFKTALRNNDLDYIIREAIEQIEAGASILDINVGLPEINEEEMMERVIKEIQSILDTPLQIDSTNPKVIERALRIYNGKAIVNSVNGEEENLDAILPIVKKYGGAIIGLTLDQRGIPTKGEDRFKIAENIVKRAEKYGIAREDIYIDTLALTVAAQQEGVKETLKALRLVKEKLGVRTILGVSNVSFGFPNRELINRTFLSAALYEGLDLAIINPLDKDMMDTIYSSDLLWNVDKGGRKYISYFQKKKLEDTISKEDSPVDNLDLKEVILKGIKDKAKEATLTLLTNRDPLDIVNNYLVPALDIVGERYEKGKIFLPQLIQSAETVKPAFQAIKEELNKSSKKSISKGRILLATVKGDIHDIGKNIVKVLLENYNYEIIDLGKDVPIERIVKTTIQEDIKLVGLSALMTTTVKSMEETIKALKKANPNTMIMVGGAVLNKEYADLIRADYYAKDAKGAVDIARNIFK